MGHYLSYWLSFGAVIKEIELKSFIYCNIAGFLRILKAMAVQKNEKME